MSGRLKSQTVELNQGLDLDLQLEKLVINVACLSSREDSGIVGNQERAEWFWSIGYELGALQRSKKGIDGMKVMEWVKRWRW